MYANMYNWHKCGRFIKRKYILYRSSVINTRLVQSMGKPGTATPLMEFWPLRNFAPKGKMNRKDDGTRHVCQRQRK